MKKLLLVLVMLGLMITPAFAGKMYDDSVIDAALAKIATCTHWTFVSAHPANYAGIAAVKLASVTVTAGNGNGAYTIADDASSPYGRKLTVAAQTGMTPTANGTVIEACCDDAATMLACTTTTSQAVTTSQTWDSPAFKLTVGDPQ